MRRFIIEHIIAPIIELASFGFIRLMRVEDESYDELLEDPEFWKKALYEELYKLQANDYKEWDEELNTLSIEVLASWIPLLTVEDRREFYATIDDELRAKFFAYIG